MTRFHTIILILLALNLNAESSGLLWASCPGDLDGSGFDTLNFDVLEPIIDTIFRVDASSTGGVFCPNDSSRVFVEVSNIFSPYPYEYRVELVGGGAFSLGNEVGDTSSQYYSPGNYELILLYNTSNSSIATSCQNVSPLYQPHPFSLDSHLLKIDSVNITDAICGVSKGDVGIYVTGDNDPFTYTLPADVESTTFKDGGLFVKRDGALIQERLTPQGQEVNRVQGYKYRGSNLIIQGLGDNQEVIFRYIPELARFTATTDTFVVTDRYLELVRAGLLHQYAVFDQDPASEVEADQRFRILMTDFIDTKRVTSDVLTFF